MKVSAGKLCQVVALAIILFGVVFGQGLGCSRHKVEQKEFIYKTIGETKLKAYLFEQQPRKTSEPVPAVLFFHGGGWFSGSPTSLFPHCEYFASCGLVAVSVQYRLNDDYNTPPYESVEDAKSAIRWLRTNAAMLNIDPKKIVAAGTSAGGHLAMCTAMLEGFENPTEDQNISSKPDAVIVLSGILDTTEKGFSPYILKELEAEMAWVKSDKAKDISPIHNIANGICSSAVLYGTGDHVVPFESVELFCRIMEKNGNTCQLIPFTDAPHSFFLYGEGKRKQLFKRAMSAAEDFLESLGYL